MRESEIDHALGDGERAAREARAGSARDEGDAVAGAEPDDRLHLLGRSQAARRGRGRPGGP